MRLTLTSFGFNRAMEKEPGEGSSRVLLEDVQQRWFGQCCHWQCLICRQLRSCGRRCRYVHTLATLGLRLNRFHIVPVYDARAVPSYDFNANLPRLANTLPAWTEGEIPYGSFVVVGHTLTVYRSQAGNMTLGCNLQWVIVIGTPDVD